jgi:hypothetical protein
LPSTSFEKNTVGNFLEYVYEEKVAYYKRKSMFFLKEHVAPEIAKRV